MENKKFNKRNFIVRIIAFPFVFALIFIAHNIFVIKRTFHFLKYGGEYVNFEENEKPTILEIYKMLKEMKEERKKEDNESQNNT